MKHSVCARICDLRNQGRRWILLTFCSFYSIGYENVNLNCRKSFIIFSLTNCETFSLRLNMRFEKSGKLNFIDFLLILFDRLRECQIKLSIKFFNIKVWPTVKHSVCARICDLGNQGERWIVLYFCSFYSIGNENVNQNCRKSLIIFSLTNCETFV